VGGSGVLRRLVLLDVGDGVAHGLDVGELVVGDGHAELVLDGGGDLDHRQGVDVQVVGERLLRGGVAGGHPGHLLQDLAEAGLDVCGAGHAGSSLSHGWRTDTVRRPGRASRQMGVAQGSRST
jgi:hypothetical protein